MNRGSGCAKRGCGSCCPSSNHVRQFVSARPPLRLASVNRWTVRPKPGWYGRPPFSVHQTTLHLQKTVLQTAPERWHRCGRRPALRSVFPSARPSLFLWEVHQLAAASRWEPVPGLQWAERPSVQSSAQRRKRPSALHPPPGCPGRRPIPKPTQPLSSNENQNLFSSIFLHGKDEPKQSRLASGPFGFIGNCNLKTTILQRR